MIREAQATLEARLVQEEAARAGLDAKREAYDRVGAAATGLESEVRAARAEIGSQREAAGQAELAVREAELRLAHLLDGVREKWDVDLASWSPPPLEAEPPAADAAETASDAATPEGVEEEEPAPDAARDARANARLARLPRTERRSELDDVRKRIQALGEVNLGAIEEHEELSERFRFLSEQKHDLDTTLASLQEAIQRINRTSRKRFRETFEAVSKHFSENFPRLFRGGKASLSLTESEDVLEAGIEIMAMPPGKRLQNVSLLSGGEKTLTAIALLIAIFQVQALALLPARRGRRRARRRQRRPLQRDRARARGGLAVRPDHPQQAHDRSRRRALRRDDGAQGRQQARLRRAALGESGRVGRSRTRAASPVITALLELRDLRPG